jgi:ABC-2 type transport system permease protein
MRRILADVKAFGTEYLRNPVGAFFAFAFPMILILVFGSVFSTSGGSTSVPLAVQDLDGSTMSAACLEALNATGSVHISMIPPTEDIEAYIKDNSLSAALLVPEGFENGIVTGNTSEATLVLYGDPSRSSYGIAAGSVSAASTIMNFQIANATPVIGLDTRAVVAEELEYIDFFLPGLIAFTVMINALFVQASVAAEYRSRGFFKLLATTPLRKTEWLFSKFLWVAVIMSASVALMFAISIPLFGVHLTVTWTAVALIMTGVLLFVSMGLLIGTLAKGVEAASAVANAIGFPMMFLSGTFFPLETMPDFLQVFARVLPLTYMSEGLRATMIYGNETAALLNLAVVAVLAVVFYAAASRLMSWRER